MDANWITAAGVAATAAVAGVALQLLRWGLDAWKAKRQPAPTFRLQETGSIDNGWRLMYVQGLNRSDLPLYVTKISIVQPRSARVGLGEQSDTGGLKEPSDDGADVVELSWEVPRGEKAGWSASLPIFVRLASSSAALSICTARLTYIFTNSNSSRTARAKSPSKITWEIANPTRSVE